MNFELIYIRVKAFAAEAGAMVAFGVLGVMSSPEFANLLTTHFGAVWGGGIGLLVLNAVVKHLLNLKALSAYQERLGSVGGNEPPVLI